MSVDPNTAALLDHAAGTDAMLLFDEADSLFGKRTADVQNANDRFANLEINYLLQRLERFNGLSILTTNLAKSIDVAFRRRFAYDVQFAFPTADLREELWRRAFPARARTAGLVDQPLEVALGGGDARAQLDVGTEIVERHLGAGQRAVEDGADGPVGQRGDDVGEELFEVTLQ